MVNFAAGRLYLKRINILTYFFFTIICIHPLSVTFVPSLSDIGDLRCMTSYLSGFNSHVHSFKTQVFNYNNFNILNEISIDIFVA